VEEYLGHVVRAVAEGRENIRDPERAALVNQVDEQAKGYQDAFAQMVQSTERFQELQGRLSETGTEALKAITEAITVLRDSNQTDLLFHAAGLRAELLAERLWLVKYQGSEQRADFDQALREFALTDQAQAKAQEAFRTQPAEVQNRLTAFAQARSRYVGLARELNQTIEQRQALEKNVMNPAGAAIAQASETLRTSYRTSQDALGPQVQAANTTTVQVTLGVAAAALALGVVLAGWLSRMISRPLRDAAGLAQRIAQGDLSAEIPVTGRDEIGQLLSAMQTMNHELRRIVGEVKTASMTVSTAASEVAQGSTDLAQRTEEQASALEETASSMEELTATVQQNADNATQASQLAHTARTQVEDGVNAVQQTISAMQGIHASSQQIADIIELIDGIAFQTNLLALNAAVEAARAGENGRGFAVVAGEVRKLAQSSADAARQIKDLIETSVGQVEDGRRLADASGEALQSILRGVKKVNDLVGEIAVASREQASGIQQVSTAILQMDQVTQQNAALVEQTSAASQQLGEQAGQLQTLMGFFHLEGGAPANSGFLAHAAQVRATADAVAAPMARRAGSRQLPTRPTRTTAHPEPRRLREDAAATTSLRPAAVSNDNQEWEAF
jgi:methyl-accepting chemotaxis protein